MVNHWLIQSKGIMTALLLLTLAVIVACGTSAEVPTTTATKSGAFLVLRRMS